MLIVGIMAATAVILLVMLWATSRIVVQTVQKATEVVYGPRDLAQPEPPPEQPPPVDLYPTWEEEPWSIPARSDEPPLS
jgi:hypothetical protein